MDRKERYRFIKPLDHPLVGMPMLIGGLAFIVLAGCMSMMIFDLRLLGSQTWWIVSGTAASLLCVSVFSCFRPYSRWILLPIALSMTITLALCIWYIWGMIQHPPGQEKWKGIIQGCVFLATWALWVGRTIKQIRER